MKTDLLVRQTRLRLPSFGAGPIAISAIKKGGSDRSFYRVRCSPDQSLILVKYNDQRGENRQYARVAQFLSGHGIRVPKIYFHDADEGLIWIEDLGETDLFSCRNDSWLVRAALYRSALDEIAKLHAQPETEWTELRGQMPPEFNSTLYRWEQGYFMENCLGHIFGLSAPERNRLASLPALSEIAEELASMPRVLVHRDLQSQNLIIRNGQVFLIDFQGMRSGLAEYDLASLLFDPYVELGPCERDELWEYYLGERGFTAEAAHTQTLQLCAMQRLMQALGAYGFLGLTRGNRQFLAHVPAAMRLLRDIVDQISGLERLAAALASLPENPVAALSK